MSDDPSITSQDRLDNLVLEGFTHYLAGHWNTPSNLDCQAVAKTHAPSLVEWTKPFVETVLENVASISYTSRDDPNNTRPLLEVRGGMPMYITKVDLTARINLTNGEVLYTPELSTVSYWSQYIPDRLFRSKWSDMSVILGRKLERAGCKAATVRVLVSLLRACESTAADQVPGTTLTDYGVSLVPDLERSYVYRRWDALGADTIWHIQVDVRGPLEVSFSTPAVDRAEGSTVGRRTSLSSIVSNKLGTVVKDVHRGTCSLNLLLHDEVYTAAVKEFHRGEYRKLSDIGAPGVQPRD